MISTCIRIPHTAPGQHRVVQAAIGAPLGSDGTRRRAVGRIGGLLGAADPAALDRLTRALGRARCCPPSQAPIR